MTVFGQAGLPASYNAEASPYLVAASQTTLTLLAHTQILLRNGLDYKVAQWTADTTITPASVLDTGSILAAGKDYYVYLCWDGLIKVSLNSTYPAGYDANTSRKIGGFHTLCCAVGTITSPVVHTLNNFPTAAILPNSVWCLNFRSSGRQEGTVYLAPIDNCATQPTTNTPAADRWFPIYPQNGTGVNTRSEYGVTIVDSRHWNDHNEDLAAVKWRMPVDWEFTVAADGSNAKTNIYGSVKPTIGNGATQSASGYSGKCAPIAQTTGSGLNDLSVDRTNYVPPVAAITEAMEYRITIASAGSPDTFTWAKAPLGGAYGAESTPATSITGGWQAIDDGILIKFTAITGHVAGNVFKIYVMNGLMDTANRRMVSHYGVEGACGVYWQWLQDQSWRYDMDAAPALTALSQTCTVFDIGSPGGNPLYLKFTASGMPYLCSNLAAVMTNVFLPMSTTHKLQITYDSGAASGGTQVFIKKANGILERLVCVVPTAKDAYLPTSSPELWVKVKYDASAASGVAINFDDGADTRLEANMTGGVSTIDLGAMAPSWAYQDLGSNKGFFYKQGTYGDVKLLAGGNWSVGSSCGPRCRYASNSRWATSTTIGGRGCADSRRS